MAGATSSIGAVGQLGKTQQAHSLFKHEKTRRQSRQGDGQPAAVRLAAGRQTSGVAKQRGG